MKNNERENDVFDELLRDALASDAAPSEDFTARLMEQVRRTPQEKPLRKQPVIKLLAAVAACAVIAVAIPLVTAAWAVPLLTRQPLPTAPRRKPL